MRTIFKGGFQLAKMRFVQVLTLVAGAFMVLAGVMMLRIEPGSPGDDLANGQLWASLFIVVGLVLAAGIWYYSQVYIARVEISDDERRLRLTFPGLFFPHRLEFEVDEVESVTYHAGYMRSGGMTVNAPWETVRIRGSRRRFVLDLHGDRLDENAVDVHLLRFPERYPHWRPGPKKPGPSPLIESAKQRKRKR